MPTVAETMTEPMMAMTETAVGQWRIARTASDAPRPARCRSVPPARQSRIASIRNWREDVLERAPTAMRRPISRVRSVTLTSMMFMIPTPPTTSEMPATISSRRGDQVGGGLERVHQLGHVADLEVVGGVVAEVVPLAEQGGDLLHRHGDFPGGGGSDLDGVDVGEADGERRVGHLGLGLGGVEGRLAGRVEVAERVDGGVDAAGGTARPLAPAELEAWFWPEMRYLMVVQGAMTTSSWSTAEHVGPLAATGRRRLAGRRS